MFIPKPQTVAATSVTHCTAAAKTSILQPKRFTRQPRAVPIAEFEMLLSFATWGKRATSWPSFQGNEQTGYLDYNFLCSPSAENFPPLIVGHFIRKATDHELEKPLGKAWPVAQSHPCLPSIGGWVTLGRWCYSCQPVTMNWSAWSSFAS